MKNIKIRIQILLGFMGTVLLAVFIGLVGIFSLGTLRDNTELLNERTHMAILSARLERNVQQQRVSYRGALAYRLMELTDNFQASVVEMNDLEQEYRSLREKLNSMHTVGESNRLLGEIDTAYTAYALGRDGFLALMKDVHADNGDIMQELEKPAVYADSLVKSVEALTDFINDITDGQAAHAAAAARYASVIMLAVIVIAITVSVCLSLYISKHISRPLSMMQDVLVQVGNTGSLCFDAVQLEDLRREGENRDEIGQSLRAFSKMLEHFLYLGKNLDAIASGDLTADIELLSQQDTMGTALKRMIEELNDVFEEIKSVSGQVYMASGEIADRALQLAQGNTEQEASVQSILQSVRNVLQQASAGASLAWDNVKNSREICAIAQNGNEKMEKLSAAVADMRGASYATEEVVKSIDEIAFSINLLALNAAVEAAHAGVHGKGFSIVAEEIRILAGRSAKAAQEAAALISANLQKSDMGLDVSKQASHELQKIVTGVAQTAEELTTMAEQSEEARVSAEHVNQQMAQVAQVMEMNGIASEHNAATSKEMNGLANSLEGDIARFQLKNQHQQRGVQVKRGIPQYTPKTDTPANNFTGI